MRMPKSFKQPTLQACLFALLFGATTLPFAACNQESTSSEKNTIPDSATVTTINNPELDSTLFYLLEASAKDFAAHQSPLPAAFRHVTVKDLPEKNGTHHYMLCGEFLSAAEGESDKWVAFATIKTSGYEQWLGGQSVGYCTEATAVQYPISDLSGELQKRLNHQ